MASEQDPIPQTVPPDMDPEAFRRYGYQVVDWIATYMRDAEHYPVLSQVAPGQVRAALPAAPPRAPESMDRILQDFERVVLPGITHWNHPAFFAYFSISSSGPGILGEALAAALNVNAMLWKTSPAATELEELTLDWLRQMLGLPEGFHGVIMDTASIASMVAIAAARETTRPGYPQARHARPARAAAPAPLHLRTGPLLDREGCDDPRPGTAERPHHPHR